MANGVTRLLGDLRDMDFVRSVLDNVRPHLIFHLAGLKAAAGNETRLLYDHNVMATANLFESAAGSGAPVVVSASSATVYGHAGPDPIGESMALAPATSYGASKAAAECLAMAACEEKGLPVIRARMFNLMGPGQADGVVGDLAHRIAAAEISGASDEPREIRVGALDARRDFIDVRDAAAALIRLAGRGEAGKAYNVATGVSHSVRQCFDGLASFARITVCPSRFAALAGREDIQVGDISLIGRVAGWGPKIPFATSLHDALASARASVGMKDP
jgi:GDP-4-dehydro-6-deoxy-D-mannose reductase